MTNPAPQKTYVFVDDHASIGEAMLYALRGECPDYRQIGNLTKAAEALVELRKLKPDLVIIDWGLGERNELNGGDVICELREELPATKWIVFTAIAKQVAREAVSAGAHGCVSKKHGHKELGNAVRTVSAGGNYYCQEASCGLAAAVGREEEMTPQERRVLVLIAGGLEAKAIGGKMGISARTVYNHIYRMREKLGKKAGSGSMVDLARYAEQVGLAAEK